MMIRSIRILFLVGLLVAQTARAQSAEPAGQGNPVSRNQAPTSAVRALQEQGRDSKEEKSARSAGNSESSVADRAPMTDSLLRLLVNKGVLTPEDARAVLSTGDPNQQRDRLATLLKDKGLISDAEFAALQAPAPDTSSPSRIHATAEAASPGPVGATPSTVLGKSQNPSAPSVIAAVAPIRLLPIDPSQREGLIPDLKLGSGARIKPYGYFKTSVIRDSSSPGGNDFPLPLLAADTGPQGSPEFI